MIVFTNVQIITVANMPAHDYVSVLPCSIASEATTQDTSQTDREGAPNYSSPGSAYATIESRGQRKLSPENVGLARESERSEAHNIVATNESVTDTINVANYEVPIKLNQSAEHEIYSQLQN